MTDTTAAIRGAGATRGLRLKTVLTQLSAMRNVARQRRALGRLSAEHLRDIGLNEDAARVEADRPFWDAPANWR